MRTKLDEIVEDEWGAGRDIKHECKRIAERAYALGATDALLKEWTSQKPPRGLSCTPSDVQPAPVEEKQLCRVCGFAADRQWGPVCLTHPVLECRKGERRKVQRWMICTGIGVGPRTNPDPDRRSGSDRRKPTQEATRADRRVSGERRKAGTYDLAGTDGVRWYCRYPSPVSPLHVDRRSGSDRRKP